MILKTSYSNITDWIIIWKLKKYIFFYFHLVKNNCLYSGQFGFLSLTSIFVSIPSFGYKRNSIFLCETIHLNSHWNWTMLISLTTPNSKMDMSGPLENQTSLKNDRERKHVAETTLFHFLLSGLSGKYIF